MIIVDDGSLLNLRPTAELFQEKLTIEFFRKDNSGPGLSRNYGARRAKNDWLIFVDSDVIVETDYIAKHAFVVEREGLRRGLLGKLFG